MTLIEVLAAAAVSILMAAIVFGLARGARPLAAASTLEQFDAAVALARAVAAASGNGATLVVEAAGPGTRMTVFSGRPTGAAAMQPGPVPPFEAAGGVAEAVFGAPPFTVFFDGAGHASGTPGAVSPSQPLPADPGCPDPPALRFTISDARTAALRTLPCRP